MRLFTQIFSYCRYQALVLTGLFLLAAQLTFANHIVGADLFYTHISGNTYKITFIAYGDCGPSGASVFSLLPSARPQVCIYDGGTSVASINLVIDTPANPYNGKEITPVCPADTANTQCTNPANTIPGIKKFIYTGTYTLPRTSHYWRFIFTGSLGTSFAGRATAITNIVTGTEIQLIDTLDNYYHNNSSPALTIVPTPFFCLNNSDSYNPGAVDPEGDSLKFSLVSGMSGTNVCSSIGGAVTYTGGFTATNPLAVSAGTLSFSSTTGQLDFFPNVTQRSLVVYNVAEYRNDTFIGTSQREMTFLVLTCTYPPPSGTITGSTGGTVLDSSRVAVCVGTGAFNVTLTPTESDTTKLIYVTTSGLPSGSTFTTINDSTNHPICTFSWNTAGVTPGTYTFFVTYKDNGCPVNGIRTNAYSIIVAPLPTVDAGTNAVICMGSTTTLTATGAATYTWVPGTGLSCTACSAPIASPVTTTLYTVTGTSIFGCVNSDTVRVTVNPLPSVITGTSPICSGTTTTLSDSVSGGTWSSSAPGVATVDPATGVVYGTSGGTATITYSLPTGCYRTFSFTVNPTPAAIGGPTSVCVGYTITATDASAGGSWSTSDATIASIVATTGLVYGVATGTATITYTLPAGCYVTRSITVNPNPQNISGTRVLCAGDTATLFNATTGGTWSSSATGVASISTGGTVTAVSGGTATISYTLPTGCYVTAGFTVNPRPAAIGGPTSLCVGNSITCTDATTGGTWSSNNTSVASINASSGVLFGVSAGSVIITYTIATGCYVTRNIIVNPLPANIGGPTVVCVGSTITVTETSSGGTWSSSATGIATVNPSTGVVYGVSVGTANITYTLPTGCYTTTTITVNPLPVPGTISGPTNVCVGNTITLTESATGGTWSTSNTLATISAGGIVTGVNAGLDTVYYAVTNSCGTLRASYIITVVAFPTVAAIYGPGRVCEQASVTFTDSTAGGTWTSGATSIAVVSAGGVVTGVSAGTATISYAITNICGTVYATKSIIVDPIPSITISPSAPDYCIGGNTTMTASGAFSYVWSPATALSATSGATVTSGATTTITYTVTGTAANSCVNRTSVTVTVHPLPTITVPPATICYGTSTVLTASGANTYVWAPAATLNSSTGNSVIATPSDSISYTVTGTDIYGCVNFTTVTVFVNPIPSAPTVTSPVKYCMTAPSVPLTAVGSALLWYNVASGGTGSGTAPTPSTAAVGNTTYYVTQTKDGCESPRSPILVVVMENAHTDFDYKLFYGCTFDTVVFTNLSQYCYSYKWYFGDGGMIPDTNKNPIHFYLPAHVPTNYIVKLYGYNAICFDDSTIKTLTLTANPAPPPVITAITPDQTIDFGQSVQLEAHGAFIYTWKPDDGSLNNNNVNNPIATPTVTTTYIVLGYDKTGCMDSAKVTITVNTHDSDFVPTGFTPNGDGQNDVFKLNHLQFGKLVEFSIYNRWGQLVFHTNDISKGWDGNFDGAPQDMGVYNYLIITAHTDGANKVHKGTVTLIR